MKWASAALRWPWEASEAATSGSTSTAALPLSARRKARRVPRESPVSDSRRSMRMRAPALMKGFRGMPFSYSSCTSELNGLPEGLAIAGQHQGQGEGLGHALDGEGRTPVSAAEELAVHRGEGDAETGWI